MDKNVDLGKYTEFVDALTSIQSKDFDNYVAELSKLNSIGCNIARLDCAATGLASEGGEVAEIVKKLKFQGKEWNEDVRFHLKRESGDIIFYWINLCLALGYSPAEIIAENVTKLESRYPGGAFDPWYSENRQENDL